MNAAPDKLPRISDLYRRYAEEASQRAELITTPVLREAMKQMAAEWVRMAELAEKNGD